MIRVVITRNPKGAISGFTVAGHAGFEQEGRDIICAAASAIAYTAIGYFNEVKYGGAPARFEVRDGYLSWKRPEIEDPAANIAADAVLEAMEIGFRQIENSYGKQYLTVMGGAQKC